MSSATEDQEPQKYLATLVRGECHYLRDIRFDHGIPTVVLSFHKDHLEEHAVDVVPVPGWSEKYDADAPRTEVRSKFIFSPYTGTLDVGRTVGASATRDAVTEGAAARLRNFSDLEAARLAKAPAETAPKFDAEARRAEVERPADAAEEVTSAPRPRAPKFPRRASAA